MAHKEKGGSEAKTVDADAIFRIFTACQGDIPTIVIDTRAQKEFKDYSSSSYNIKWSQDCWWGRNVLVYGEPGLKKDHPVIAFLSRQGKCRNLRYYKDGFEAFAKAYPYLCTTSLKSICIKRYPSQILPGQLYLGDWEHAADNERLAEMGIRRILTIHNHPENLRPPAGIKHLRQQLPDIEDADISAYFSEAFDFIDEGRERKQPVLVHCGAGVSRSATLVMMYLMRRNSWSAARARGYVVERRSVVCINDGFYMTLCALEPQLGIAERSDPNATFGFRGADAPEPQQIKVVLSEDAAGQKVPVRLLAAKEAAQAAEADKAGAAGAKRPREGGEGGDTLAAKRSRPGEPASAAGGAGAFTLVFDVVKPEGLVGRLEAGPMRPSQRLLLGRQPGVCDVVLEHASISRQHAALSVDRAGAAFVTDLQSAHGTKVADTWIKPNAPRQLTPGTVVSFGASTRAYKLVRVSKAD
eukprot:XP_001700990.1 MAP kinase phosphatase 5 [Chlamydomonas reinhardtii]